MRDVLIDIFVYRNPIPSPSGRKFPFRVQATVAGQMVICPPFYEETEEKLAARVKRIKEWGKPDDVFRIQRREQTEDGGLIGPPDGCPSISPPAGPSPTRSTAPS
jgi:hypothetical protein